MQTNDQGDSVEQFANRASSAFYASLTSSRPLSTFGAAMEFGKFSPCAALLWQNRIADIKLTNLCSVLDRIPNERMTAIAKEFTLRLMKSNQARISEMVSWG